MRGVKIGNKMKVALFIPCLSEHFYPDAALSMVKVLNYLGVEVEYVKNQTCCGQPALNAGHHKLTLPLVEHFLTLFKDKEFVVAPSGSCVATVRLFYKRLKVKKKLIPALDQLTVKVFEFSEFLINVLKTSDLGGRFPHRVTYHDSCQLSRMLGVREQPRKLIKGIDGIELVEMENSDLCCGFGGTFSYKFKDVSIEMVKRKCDYIEATKAEFCIGADSSCLMNIEGFLRKNGYKAKTIHIADLLAQSLGLKT
jgi:L-lactate dehydrogenase complex protein LldE